MKIKGLIFFVSIFVVICLISFSLLCIWAGYNFFIVDHSTVIKEGFSQENVTTLYDSYGIKIPDDAVFIREINVASRDPVVMVLFEIPFEHDDVEVTGEVIKEYLCSYLNVDSSRFSYGLGLEEYSTDHYYEMGGNMDYSLTDNQNMFTSSSLQFMTKVY